MVFIDRGIYPSIQKENWLSSSKSLQHFAEVISVCTMSIHLLKGVHENSDPDVSSEKQENSQE